MAASPVSDTDVSSSISDRHERGANDASIKKLRLLCTETVASMPHGTAVLEELANVAQTIGETRAAQIAHCGSTMPYPLPDLPHINHLQVAISDAPHRSKEPLERLRSPSPPPLPEPPTAPWLGVPTESNPKLLVCLSPSQQSYIQSNPANRPDELLDAHQRFVERRGYHEYSAEEVKAINRERLEEQRILETAAIMKKLRKSLSPPPVPPPPVPSKSAATAAKAQCKTNTANMRNDASVKNADPTSIPADGEENKHRLLAIIQNANGSATRSAHPNRIRPATSEQSEPPRPALRPVDTTDRSAPPAHSPMETAVGHSEDPFRFPVDIGHGDRISSVENEFAKIFPAMGEPNVFDATRKRFSNIESSLGSPFDGPILRPEARRYSNIETRSYESKKRVENGQVVYDLSNSTRESQTEGDPALQPPSSHLEGRRGQHLPGERRRASESENATNSKETSTNDAAEMMSQLKINMENRAETSTKSSEKQATTTTTTAEERKETGRKCRESEPTTKDGRDTYEEFRQRAKAAAGAVPAPTPSHTAAPHHFDHETLFKDFDDLSKQLHMELESGKAKRVQREKSSSLYDLSRMRSDFGQRIEDIQKQRHEHMLELEQQIERSMKSRQLRQLTAARGSVERQDAQGPAHVVKIPIQIENGGPPPHVHDTPMQPEAAEAHHRVHEIPVQVESSRMERLEDDPRFRRSESMFNLSHEQASRPHHEMRRPSDDWARYAKDLGSSENITRPFAREVEICYQRQRPNTIRAPRLTASTMELSSAQGQHYDTHNAYNVRRTHAPMLSQVPQKGRPQYSSCYSMIDRDPNPTYISTTSRRGVSPGPAGPAPPVPSPTADEYRQRRASLPREIHEQQLRYITSKEEELKTEFERLQNERRRLMEEMTRAPVAPPVQPPPRMMRDLYRPAVKLPTLSEDEVFRQQMAEEWLHKVAEREERRNQKIIKISKVQEGEGRPTSMHSNPDLGEEFLTRVKERRCKLAMPHDSDWESGAESQPHVAAAAQVSETEEGPPMRILDGKSETDLRQLPRHLREFARFSNHEKEKLNDGEREVRQEEEHRKEANENSVCSASKKSSYVKTFRMSRVPPTATATSMANPSLAQSNGGIQTHRTAGGLAPADQELLSTQTTTATTTTTTTTATPTTTTTQSPQPPTSLFETSPFVNSGDFFAESPFKTKIREEFEKYWRNFDQIS